MKLLLASAAILTAFGGIIAFDLSERTCTTGYSRSFNGLWLLKVERCKGRLGMYDEGRTIARKPLFQEF